MTATPAVELRGITKRFDDIVAVDAIDMHIAGGEFFAMLGPSGCGKTTTLRVIAGLEFPTEGSVRIFGDEVGTLPPNKRPVNTVFQSYALFPHMNVLDNVAFGLRMSGVSRATARQRARDMIALVRLSGMENRRPAQMSGGQQQRVALARALVNEPKVLLLDEPLAALDLKLRHDMQLELKELQRRLGISFVFVTHDQEEALTMSDRIAVMDNGQLLQVGTPEEIYERPANRFVADFIGTANLLDATVVDASTVCLANGTRVAARSAHPSGTAVAICLRPERARVVDGQTSDESRVTGVIETVTYVGNARVYTIRCDWMALRVREDNRPGSAPRETGDKVAVTWDIDAVTVVAE